MPVAAAPAPQQHAQNPDGDVYWYEPCNREYNETQARKSSGKPEFDQLWNKMWHTVCIAKAMPGNFRNGMLDVGFTMDEILNEDTTLLTADLLIRAKKIIG